MPKGNGNVRKRGKFSSLSFTLNIKPFSANKMYTGRKRRSCWYKQYEKQIRSLLPSHEIPNHGTRLQLHITFGTSTVLFDCDNIIKPLSDCIQKHYNFNDNQIYYITVRKKLVNKGKEYIKFEIKRFKGQIDERKKYTKNK